jgi:hypothetical protein
MERKPGGRAVSASARMRSATRGSRHLDPRIAGRTPDASRSRRSRRHVNNFTRTKPLPARTTFGRRYRSPQEFSPGKPGPEPPAHRIPKADAGLAAPFDLSHVRLLRCGREPVPANRSLGQSLKIFGQRRFLARRNTVGSTPARRVMVVRKIFRSEAIFVRVTHIFPLLLRAESTNNLVELSHEPTH